jgi:hypothetical protein
MEHHEGRRQNGKYIIELVTSPNILALFSSPYPLASLGTWIPHIPKELSPPALLWALTLASLNSWGFTLLLVFVNW